MSGNDPGLRVFLVYEPILDEDTYAAAAGAAASITDARVSRYWDVDLRLSRELGEVLSIPPRHAREGRFGVAWDVYLFYPAGAQWNGDVPSAPAFWMHQLNQVNAAQAPFLDGARLREAVMGSSPMVH